MLALLNTYCRSHQAMRIMRIMRSLANILSVQSDVTTHSSVGFTRGLTRCVRPLDLFGFVRPLDGVTLSVCPMPRCLISCMPVFLQRFREGQENMQTQYIKVRMKTCSLRRTHVPCKAAHNARTYAHTCMHTRRTMHDGTHKRTHL